MDIDEYRKRGKEMVDYIADYLENIRERRVFPDVKPGYMRNLLPDSAPLEGEHWDKIIDDVERVIMPGVTHWQSPHMHAYFPALNSFPSLLGDMLADSINCLGFTWASSPACTELETIVMNWLGKMIGLPDDFLHSACGRGGGVIQTTASESTLICLLAGRTQAIRRFHEMTPGFQDAEINARLVAYCSDQAHSSVEKAALIGLVRMRYIESDEKLSLRGDPLRDAIESDIQTGLIPFWVCATLGTTGACAFDNLEEVTRVCQEYRLWCHVDAAYAGSAFLCPEYRNWLKGIDRADSIAFNPSKWLMVHFDCTAMWVKNSGALHRTFNVEPLYLQHENSGLAIDYMHWQIPLSKRFRSIKLWFVIRSYGIKGLQKHIREGVRLAQKFEALVLGDVRFEIPAIRHLGLVVFRLRGENDLTERLLKRLNHRGNIHCVPSSLKGKYVIRFTVTSARTTNEDIVNDWAEIRNVATEILAEMNIKICDRVKVSLKETREKNEAFGSSLLLSNCPMSPKVVNGSFAAIFDADEFLAKAYAGIRVGNHDSPAMRRRVRGILMSGKQFSLDSRMDLVVQGIGTADPAVQTPRAINEDCEENWEVCEKKMVMKTQSDVVQKAQVPLLNDRCHNQYRSQSLDGSVPALNNYCTKSLTDSKTFDCNIDVVNKSLSIIIDNEDLVGSLECFSHKNLVTKKVNSSKPLASVLSPPSSIFSNNLIKTQKSNFHFNTTLHCLNRISEEENRSDENDFAAINLDIERKYRASYIMQYPEKRQSEPAIQYSFLNYGFEASINENKKFLSQNDLITKYDHKTLTKPTKPLANPSLDPKLPILCVIDEYGNQINKSINSPSEIVLKKNPLLKEQSIDIYIDDVGDDKTDQCDYNVSENQMKRGKQFEIEETINGCFYYDRQYYVDDETVYENIKLCKKCGHTSVRL